MLLVLLLYKSTFEVLHIPLQCDQELLLLQNQLLEPFDLLLILLCIAADSMLLLLLLKVLLLLQIDLWLLIERVVAGCCVADCADSGMASASAVASYDFIGRASVAACAGH